MYRHIYSLLRHWSVSQASLTYAEAQSIIDDTSRNDNIAASLRNLNNLAKKLKARRIEDGALTLASPEIRFEVDSETHDPIQVQEKQLRYVFLDPLPFTHYMLQLLISRLI